MPSSRNPARRHRVRAVVIAAVLAIATLAAACGDDDGEEGGPAATDGEATGAEATREDYVEALAASNEEGGDLSDEDARCIAEAAVDAIGVDNLRDAVTPEEIRDDPGFNPADAGIDLGEAEAGQFYDGVSACIDVRQLFLDSLREDQQLPPDVVDCIDEAVDDELLRDILVAQLIQGEGEQLDPDLAAEINQAIAPCQPTTTTAG